MPTRRSKHTLDSTAAVKGDFDGRATAALTSLVQLLARGAARAWVNETHTPCSQIIQPNIPTKRDGNGAVTPSSFEPTKTSKGIKS